MSNIEKRKDIDKLLEIVENLLKETDIKVGRTRANAYTVRLEDFYAIELRDEFNVLKGEWNGIVAVKNEILKMLEEKTDE